MPADDAVRLRAASVVAASSNNDVHLESRRTAYQDLLPAAELEVTEATVARFTSEWRERLDGAPARLVLVLETALGEVVGFAAAGWNEPAGELPCELYSLYLLAAAQRRGGGRRLLEATLEHFRGQGAPSLGVWVFARNPACGFYEAMGGARAGNRTLVLGGVELEEVAYTWRLRQDLD